MVSVTAVLAAMGAADALADFSGHPRSARRIMLATGAGVALVPFFEWGLVGEFFARPWSTLTAQALILAWILLRFPPNWSERRAGVVLVVLASVLVALSVGGTSWAERAGTPWIESLLDVDPESVRSGALFGALLLWLAASANAVTRLVLAVAGRDTPTGKEPLRGGRIVGPMERWLIFGLAVAGSVAAAGIVAGAKGLLRFPEILGSNSKVHETTEYLLVGSLSSWLLALAAAALVRIY